jgi:hypothetical protein
MSGMTRYNDDIEVGLNELGRASQHIIIPVGALVGTSAGGSSDLEDDYDFVNPANWELLPADRTGAIKGYRTLGFNFASLGAGETVQVVVRGKSALNKYVSDTCTVTSALPAFVTKYAYGDDAVITFTPSNVASGATVDICSVGFGVPAAFKTEPLQILFYDASAANAFAVDDPTYDANYQTFVPSSTAAVGDWFQIIGCPDSIRVQNSGNVNVSPAASF